jgi:hypothetical protein
MLMNQHGANCGDTSCCPTLFDEKYGEVRVNAHCDFEGHCIQLKNTFIHVQCNHADSEGEDCMVCKITRSQSCDVRPRARLDSDGEVQDIPLPEGANEAQVDSEPRGRRRGRQRQLTGSLEISQLQ